MTVMTRGRFPASEDAQVFVGDRRRITAPDPGDSEEVFEEKDDAKDLSTSEKLSVGGDT